MHVLLCRGVRNEPRDHRHAVDTSAEKLVIAKRMGADEAPGV